MELRFALEGPDPSSLPAGDTRGDAPRGSTALESAPMKIAVCVKEVPEAAAASGIDPATKRLDRSRRGRAERRSTRTRSRRRCA